MDTTTMMRRRNVRVTEQLLGELEAKRFDSALTARILAAPSAFPRLLRACFLAQADQLAGARLDLDAALDHAGPRPNPVIGLVAGVLAFVIRDYDRALGLLEPVVDSAPKGMVRHARRQIVQIHVALGRREHAIATIDAAIAVEPDEPSWAAYALQVHQDLDAHAHDHARLEQAKRLLIEALARYQGPRR